jgi:hypothetical protein
LERILLVIIGDVERVLIVEIEVIIGIIIVVGVLLRRSKALVVV